MSLKIYIFIINIFIIIIIKKNYHNVIKNIL